MSASGRGLRCLLQLNGTRRTTRDILRRRFTQTAHCARRRQLPTFTETSNEELSNILQLAREQILIPGFLNATQRDLIFNPKSKSQLENEDITAEIGEERILLQHIDLFIRISKEKAFKGALERVETDEDWQNLLALLEGFGHARVKLPLKYGAEFVRKAILAHQIPIALKCLRDVDVSLVSLSDRKVLIAVLQGGIHLRIIEDGLTEGEVEELFDFARSVMELLEFPGHLGKSSLGKNDPRTEPWVLGTILEATAIRQIKVNNGEDEDGLVAMYLDRLLSAAKGSPLDVFELPNAETTGSEKKRAGSMEVYARVLMPLWNGLRLAEGVLGSEYPYLSEANTLKDTVGKKIERALRGIQEMHLDKEYGCQREWRRLNGERVEVAR